MMRPIENPQAEPVPISDREFDQYAELGYRFSDDGDRRVVYVPSAIYQEADAVRRKAMAKRLAAERNRRRERSKQRRLAKAGR